MPPQLKDKAAQITYYARMLDEIRALPGVWSAAINTVMPFGHLAATTSFTAEGSQIPSDRWRSESSNERSSCASWANLAASSPET